MVTLNFVRSLNIESRYFVAGFICLMSDRDTTKDPHNLLQLLLLAFRFAAEEPCRRNTEWCRKRFPCRWRRLLYTKAKKKGANGFLVKEIHVSGLTGSEYCWRPHDFLFALYERSSILTLLGSGAECTAENSWRWAEKCPKHVQFYNRIKFG